ncbi:MULTISPECIES: Com family DNA-binding transcriptional regulator [Pseudomonas]|uniref:Com family DNA-binding transcriptional regulator n=2 Tax=Pseudomonas mandelii TaxID=75612 RepID=A0AB36CQ21_9PSED|nr:MULTISPECIES: Com family DNA-binding transcriptional regulator [Pseudomonas]MDO8406704.1 Com family DNA-binding transcriptional regulator [Pseudomonas sp.]NMZ78026.1 Com family DNA-binding transcriptional regulator [Pseudomonas mandelii]TWS11751.1 Com family DNA-binding transcriptional regulator [Pseudomonas mandelii]SDU08388.1 Mu-like prophage protein Com [Pseudomonas mandelii]
MLSDFRCGKCNRLLAKVDVLYQVQIKCPRCATLNHVKTESLGRSPVSEINAASTAKKQSIDL